MYKYFILFLFNELTLTSPVTMPRHTNSLTDFIRTLPTDFMRKYSFSDTVYINARTKITVFCFNCQQPFEMLPLHFRDHGCSRCANNQICLTKFQNLIMYRFGEHISIKSDSPMIRARDRLLASCLLCAKQRIVLPFALLKQQHAFCECDSHDLLPYTDQIMGCRAMNTDVMAF